MLSSPGIGSGLDVNSLVTQLVELEREPLFRLVSKEAGLTSQLSAYGQVKSVLASFEDSLSGLDSFSDFRKLKASSSDADVLTASASVTAISGTYGISVDRLAEGHRMATDSVFPSLTNPIAAAGDEFAITTDDGTFTLDLEGLSLNEIRDAINQATIDVSGQERDLGVSASLVTDDLGSRLLLTADKTGSDGFFSVAATVAGGDPFDFQTLNGDRNGDLVFDASDLDARIVVEGQYSATRSTNVFTNVIQGVTITAVEPGSSVVQVAEDSGAARAAVDEFMSAYNEVLGTLRQLSAGALSSDATALSAIENNLRSALNTTLRDNTFASIYELGIGSRFVFGANSRENGQLELDGATLDRALQDDPEAVAALFTDSANGIVGQMKSVLRSLVEPTGTIDGRTASLNLAIDDVGRSREALEARVARFEERTRAQFESLDSLIAQLTVTSNFLTQQLAVLPPITRNR